MLNLQKTNSGNSYTQTKDNCECVGVWIVNATYNLAYPLCLCLCQQCTDKSVALRNPFVACSTSICRHV